MTHDYSSGGVEGNQQDVTNVEFSRVGPKIKMELFCILIPILTIAAFCSGPIIMNIFRR